MKTMLIFWKTEIITIFSTSIILMIKSFYRFWNDDYTELIELKMYRSNISE